MFRQVCTVALLVLAALGHPGLATAHESKDPSGKTKSPPKVLSLDLGGGVKSEHKWPLKELNADLPSDWSD